MLFRSAVIVIPSPSTADVRCRGLGPLTAPLMSLSRTLVEPIDGVGGADMDDPDDSEAPAPEVDGPLSEENEAMPDAEVLSEAQPPPVAVPGRSDLLLDMEAEEK